MTRKKSKSRLRVNQVQIEFTQKPITAWGGVGTLIAKFLEKIEFREWVESHIPIQETSNNAKGVFEKVLASFLTVLVGGSRFAHLLLWQHGVEAILQTFAVQWVPKASTSLTRFWGKINRQVLAEELGENIRGFAHRILQWEAVQEDNLNLDSTVLTRYGEQEGAKKGYNPNKRGRASHHPLLAFLGSGYVVNVWNRSGNTSSGQSAHDFFRQTVVSLGKNFSVKRVLCDSGFYLVNFIQHLESNHYTYIIAVPMIPVIQDQLRQITVWTPLAEGIETGEFWFEHVDPKWTRKRRYIAVRKLVRRHPKVSGKQMVLFDTGEAVEYRTTVLITNDTALSPEDIWMEYRPRANDENILKELKEGFGLAAFNLQNFWATEAFLQMNAMVFFNLIHYLNRTILNKNAPQEQLQTLRIKYFILPAQLGSRGGSPVLRLGIRDKKGKAKIRYLLETISRLSTTVNCNAVHDP